MYTTSVILNKELVTKARKMGFSLSKFFNFQLHLLVYGELPKRDEFMRKTPREQSEEWKAEKLRKQVEVFEKNVVLNLQQLGFYFTKDNDFEGGVQRVFVMWEDDNSLLKYFNNPNAKFRTKQDFKDWIRVKANEMYGEEIKLEQ